MNKRILSVRKSLKLSQDKFGDKIGITGATVSRLESGDRAVTDSMFKLICSTYNVNEHWLRTGEGEMFNQDPNDELSYLVGKLLADDNPFRKRFITEMMELEDEQWEDIENFIHKILRD